MRCGRDYHNDTNQQNGCGHYFSWDSAREYQAQTDANERVNEEIRSEVDQLLRLRAATRVRLSARRISRWWRRKETVDLPTFVCSRCNAVETGPTILCLHCNRVLAVCTDCSLDAQEAHSAQHADHVFAALGGSTSILNLVDVRQPESWQRLGLKSCSRCGGNDVPLTREGESSFLCERCRFSSRMLARTTASWFSLKARQLTQFRYRRIRCFEASN
jgi:hypothetical protein